MSLEEMSAFFAKRLEGYDAHMLGNIAGAREFYPFTASLLPREPGCRVLDLGCGTGLELEYYFQKNPAARVTGIDLSWAMLDRLRHKFPDKDLELICGSYFDVPLGTERFDGAVSVESLHHFTAAEKETLYSGICRTLRPGGSFLLTDYFAQTQEEEEELFGRLAALKAEQGAAKGVLYHFDTPLTVAHEKEALLAAGFSCVEELGSWQATHMLRAWKELI